VEPIAAGRHVILRPVLPEDYPTVFQMEHASRRRVATYRNRGASVPLEQYGQLLWAATLCQFMAERRDGRVAGLVVCYDADFRNGVAKLAFLRAGEDDGLDAAMAEAVDLFVAYVLETFDLRRLHADCLESNLPPMRSAIGTLFEVEACFKEREFVDGRYEDLLVLTLTRAAWESWRAHRSTIRLPDPLDLDGFLDVVSDLLGVPAGQLDGDSPLGDLDLDSLTTLELVSIIEGPETLPDDALATCETLRDCHRLFDLVRTRSPDLAAVAGG
jgi:acyl carrier protein